MIVASDREILVGGYFHFLLSPAIALVSGRAAVFCESPQKTMPDAVKFFREKVGKHLQSVEKCAILYRKSMRRVGFERIHS